MADEKKTPEEEKAESKPAEFPQEAPKADEKPPEEKPEEKPTEAPENEEKSEGETVPEKDEKPPENGTEGETEPETAPPELSEEDKLREENFRLKTQLEAMKIGFVPDVIEDAIILAEGEWLSNKKRWQDFWKKIALSVGLFFGIYLDYVVPMLFAKAGMTLGVDLPFALIICCYIVLNDAYR